MPFTNKLAATLLSPLLLISPGLVGAAPATEDGALGLYAASDFRIGDGRCPDCGTIPQALWYFENETLALPAAAGAGATYAATVPAQADIAHWMANDAHLTALPPLIWLGSGDVIAHAHLAADGKSLRLPDGKVFDFALVPRISSNRAYWNEDTLAFFARHPLRQRGESEAAGYVARTVWPLDFRIDRQPSQPLASDESLQSLVQFEQGGANSGFQSRLLWERTPGVATRVSGHAVVGLMLNGAQGDDDEAHGGHFAMATGRFEEDGDWSRWLVNNFYNLDAYSEKNIVAAVTPMDKYLMDLNSGQSYYRPSYMLVAVFGSDRPATLYQGAIDRVYNHFYRHDFAYDHSRANCAGISIDTFRTLGWQVPTRGVEGYGRALAAYAYVAATTGSLTQARQIYDYLTTETTRLYPAVAFDAMGHDLLALAQGKSGRKLTPLEREMAQQLEAIWFVRIPQIPSSRADGQAPVYSFAQYLQQAPADRSQWQIVPVEPRPFPQALRDGLALQSERPPVVPLPLLAILALLALLPWLAVRAIRRKRRRRMAISSTA